MVLLMVFKKYYFLFSIEPLFSMRVLSLFNVKSKHELQSKFSSFARDNIVYNTSPNSSLNSSF